MNILTVKRLPTNEEELTFLKDFFGEDIIINLYNEKEDEPIGFRKSTPLEIKFLSEMKAALEKQK